MRDLMFRKALRGDLVAIVGMLADDEWGRTREDPSLPLDARYLKAFDEIDSDPNQLLAVAVSEGILVGCLQLSFLRGLSHRGAMRGQIEGVRVAGHLRGSGVGARMIAWAVATCRERGCGMVQLSTTKARTKAQRFYVKLGFKATHEGMKLAL